MTTNKHQLPLASPSAPAPAPAPSPAPVSATPYQSNSNEPKMSGRNLRILWAVLSKVPLAIRVAVMHVLGLSEPSKYLDLRSHLIISVLRSYLENEEPMSVDQGQDVDQLILVASPPETSIRDALVEVIESMGQKGVAVRMPEIADVEAEWTGYRAAASPKETLPNISEAEKYREMMKECRDPTTVLYFHGGAYYLLDPATHRPTNKKLAKILGGRCYSVRYRLAPKHPFPSALLDALVSYFTLLYPPPDAFHEAVKPEHIVLSGDSAGGNLSLALLQVLLQLRRQDKHIYWYGERREVPLPAGVAVISPWADITLSSPLWQGNDPRVFDWMPKPKPDAMSNFYADDEIMAHPLVSIITAGSWEGSPPVYMCTGWERLEWEDKALARKMAADGVPLVFEEYEAMSHCFALFLTSTPNSRRCFDSWTTFIRRAVNDPASIKPSATMIKARTLEEVPLQFEHLVEENHEAVLERVTTMAKSFGQQPAPVAKL
ncbi:Acetyl-hydrolase [Cladobotryum mycophilum]|uniref:Acetyl-hydrolase n=1 Tax=Cladobotryum mycophilum TaxID=491253 RepID=A0ABR0S6L8_9HYPO